MKMTRARTIPSLIFAVLVTGLLTWGCGGQNNSSVGNPSPTTGSNPAPTATPSTSVNSAPSTSASTEVSLAVGDAVFKMRCEMCHGPNGMGDGPAGQALNPRPRNFHDKAYMSTLTDAQIESTIWNGKPGTAMPPWKGVITESELRSLVLKVRSFSKS